MFVETSHTALGETYNQEDLFGDVQQAAIRKKAYETFYTSLSKLEDESGKQLVCFLQGPELGYEFVDGPGGSKQVFISARILWRCANRN